MSSRERSASRFATECGSTACHAPYHGVFLGTRDRWAVLRFTPGRARWVASEGWHADQEGALLANGRYELHVPYTDDRELIMDIMKYGSDCEVIGPEALRARVAAEFAAGLARYGTTA